MSRMVLHFSGPASAKRFVARVKELPFVTSLIESRIGEILGDALPAPVLRAELRELINKIEEK